MKIFVPVLLFASAAVVPLSARAVENTSPFAAMFAASEGRSQNRVAELSAEERALFRQQWQNLPPKEREVLLRTLKQQWRELPPEERAKQRMELIQRMRGASGKAIQGQEVLPERDDGYGQGFEARRWERPETGGGGGGSFGRNRN